MQKSKIKNKTNENVVNLIKKKNIEIFQGKKIDLKI